MDREHDGARRGDDGQDFALPSRLAAIEACRAALQPGEGGEAGPILLTGEAGAGKTWLWRRLAAERREGCRWLAVDLAPSSDPAELHRSLGHALGLAGSGPDRDRRPLADFLAEQAEEGRRWSLVVDEAHNAPPDVLEELRLLSNRLGGPDGFASMILAGQTRLARRLATAPFAALEARIASRIHLRPIDADEARLLLDDRRPGRSWAVAEVDELHREAAGNPRRLLRLASSTRPKPTRSSRPEVSTSPPPVALPRLGVDRPPLRVEEGLIEVGWEGPEDDESSTPALAPAPRRALTTVAPEIAAGPAEDEPIDDPYAALQARHERARNRGLQPAQAPVDVEDAEEDDDLPAQFQAHESQDFAPYSQLFSRLKQAAAHVEG